MNGLVRRRELIGSDTSLNEIVIRAEWDEHAADILQKMYDAGHIDTNQYATKKQCMTFTGDIESFLTKVLSPAFPVRDGIQWKVDYLQYFINVTGTIHFYSYSGYRNGVFIYPSGTATIKVERTGYGANMDLSDYHGAIVFLRKDWRTIEWRDFLPNNSGVKIYCDDSVYDEWVENVTPSLEYVASLSYSSTTGVTIHKISELPDEYKKLIKMPII